MNKLIKWGIVAFIALIVLVVIPTSTYNGLVRKSQATDQAWAQVQNVYQRRADLIPNLVATVKGSAKFEQDTLRQVTEARARVGQVAPQASPTTPNDPAAFQRFAQAQDQLSGALSRLLVVVERYPELKSTAAFQELMASLEGTENRIAVERRRYNEVARTFNASRRRVPTIWFINLLGWDFPPKQYFAAQPGAQNAPKVEF